MEDMSKEIDNKTVNEGVQKSESDKENLYGDIIHKEARLLLSKYLPEALPQEPTEIFFDIAPGYRGKFKGKHYVVTERVIISHAQQERFNLMFRRQKEIIRQFEREMEEWVKLIKEKAEKGEFDFEEINNQFVSNEQEPEPEPKPEPEDWEEPERLLKGRDQYSVDTWGVIYCLVHELIHQRQAELNPKAFPDLSSSDLNNRDPDNVPKAELKRLVTEAHKTYSRTMNSNSIFYPVIEGMAVAGSYFVMGRFLGDLVKSGQTDIAEKIKQLRNKTIHMELIETERKKRSGEVDSYNLHYVEGVGIIRKLYRQFGIENTPGLLKSVDLTVCLGIVKGTPQYQQIIEDPALLPGLQTGTKS